MFKVVVTVVYFLANPDFTETPGIFPSLPVKTPSSSVVASITRVITE